MVHLKVFKDGLYHGKENLKHISEGIHVACGMKKSWQNERSLLHFIITIIIIRIPTASGYKENILCALGFFFIFIFIFFFCFVTARGLFHKNKKIKDFGSWCFR